ncbi:hypothetical protein [Xanthobacter autotrophicus]|uniref:hypothetical protein n=1 Tax=Xanthobacter autotrophicus TaxID=280 RepID=UPI00372BF82F
MAAVSCTPHAADTLDDWEPSPPSQEDIDFQYDVDFMIAWLASIRNRHDRVAIADMIDLAIGVFQRIWRPRRNTLHFGARQRDYLLEALAGACLGVEIHFLDEEQDGAVDALRALQCLTTYYSKPVAGRSLPHDRMADLIDYVRFGQNIARNIVLADALERRAAQRKLSSLDFGDAL